MNRIGLVFEKQLTHLVLLVLLLLLLYSCSHLPGFRHGELWGIKTITWFYLALANTLGHHIYVWLCWRLQLHLKLITGLFGRSAFAVYAVPFTVFLLSRAFLITTLAIANRGTLPADPDLTRLAGLLLLVPVVYLGYSVQRYFTFRRAMGIDHFDESYRDAPLVREGIFRLTPNSMYTFGFLFFWAVALFFSSVAAISFALFSHLYIWVHYFCTEKPDMIRIYGP